MCQNEKKRVRTHLCSFRWIQTRTVKANVKQDVGRTLSQRQRDIISDMAVNQTVGRLCDLQLAPILTQNTINSNVFHLILRKVSTV